MLMMADNSSSWVEISSLAAENKISIYSRNTGIVKDRKKNKSILEAGSEKAQSCNVGFSWAEFGEMAALCHNSESCPGAPPSLGVLRLCPQMWAEFKDWMFISLIFFRGQ